MSGNKPRMASYRQIENSGTINYSGLSRDDLISMMEERFQHMLKKEEDIRNIFEENRRLTDEMMRQNEEFQKKNDNYRDAIHHNNELQKCIDLLTDKLINTLGTPKATYAFNDQQPSMAAESPAPKYGNKSNQ